MILMLCAITTGQAMSAAVTAMESTAVAATVTTAMVMENMAIMAAGIINRG